jgi:ABC-type transport system substrate-binding protein/DNA-binding SARP family transcriptional activator/streptogramin lyase
VRGVRLGTTTGIDYRLLGAIEAGVNGHVLDIGGQKQRALLAVLLLSANKPVSREVLVDRLWGQHPPAGAQHTLEVYVSRLRKTLEPAAGCEVVLTRPGAYLLRASGEHIDVRRFERLAREGRHALAANAPGQAAADLREALGLWRGDPLSDISHEHFAQPEIARLAELRASAIEDRVEADIALGSHADVVSELGLLIAAHPLRERLYQLLMIALYRSGRQAEALAVYQSARSVLVQEIGIEPGPGLRQVERAILEQDASLEPSPAAARRHAPGGGDARPPPAARSRGTRFLVASVVCLAVVVALFAGAASIRTHGPASPVVAGPNTVAVIDASRNVLTSVLTGIGRPGGIAHRAGATWVTDTADDLLLRVDSAGRVVDRVPVGRGPAGVAVESGQVWVANQLDGTISEVNPAAGTVVATIDVGNGPVAIATGYGSVWVSNVTDNTLSRIDPGSGHVLATIPLGDAAAGLAAGEGGIWVAGADPGRLLLVDPRTNRLARAVAIGSSPASVAIGAGSVWIADSAGTVARFDPATGRVQKFRVGGSPTGIAYANGAVFVANGHGGGVIRIDPRTGSVRSIHTGNEPTALVAAGGDVLTTVLPSPVTHRGGTLTLIASLLPHDQNTDPAVAFTIPMWQMLSVTNDGLVGYRRVGGPLGDTLVPDLAQALPAPTSNGLAYTFRLRPGIRYSTGALVRPENFRRAIERVFSLNKLSGAAAIYAGIAGARACQQAPSHCDLARGIVTNDRANTITFHLTAPDPEFLYKLAFSFADAVPAGTPNHLIRPGQLPATGAYMTRSFVPGHRWVLVRNPRFHLWSDKAQPSGYPDRIVLRLDISPGPAVNAVERGSADVLLSPSPASLPELATRYAGQLHSGPLGATIGLVLNTRVWPFNVLAARQAVNAAIDRNKLIRLIGGPLAAQPTCQVLPPALPGYRPYCPYTLNPGPGGVWTAPDLARAERLVRASGTRGARVTVVTGAFGTKIPDRTTGRYLVSVLDHLGYRASLRVITDPNAYAGRLYDSRQRTQVGWFSWYQDYPAPSDFIGPLLTCRSFIPGSPLNLNAAEFCDRRIDAQVRQALMLQPRDPNAAAALWARIDREIADHAPWVPIYNPRSLVMLSARVGNYQFDPYWSLLIDQLWVH